jgi:hypothetical protein
MDLENSSGSLETGTRATTTQMKGKATEP